MSFGSVYPCYIDITQLRPPQKPWGNRKVKKSTEKSKNDPKNTRSYQLGWALCRSEGFARTAYFVPGCDGMGVRPNSEIVQPRPPAPSLRPPPKKNLENTYKVK